jgi:hypothetical protein
VITHVRGGAVGYGGYWPDGAFPGRTGRPPGSRSLAEQLAVWRGQIETLVAEVAAGDTRLFVDDPDDALGEYAPLTRAPEQLALRRGATATW